MAVSMAFHVMTTSAQYVPSDRMRKIRSEFQDRKFGIFVHWGVYSMLGDGAWSMWDRNTPREEYRTLAGGFCPSWFSAREWALLFKDAGAQYVTFTARHHDGFSMWDSEASEYNIVKTTPFGRDVIKELSATCAQEGLKFNLYYSHMDWDRDDYPLGKTSAKLAHEKENENWTAYYTFMNRQLTELLTHYGPIGAIWFDGMWDHPEADFDWRLDEQYELIHRLQPDCMIGNNHHGDIRQGEDFQLFEQDFPGENTSGFAEGQKVSELPLETCMTMNDSWAYRIYDRNYKSPQEVIRRLVRSAGMNANFLLNVGPRPDGQLPEPAVKILKEVGTFMQRYGRSIYSTRGGVVPPQPWGVTTQNKKTLYIHILNQEKEGRTVNEGIQFENGHYSILLPKGAYSIRGVKRMGTTTEYSFRTETDGTRIFLPHRPTTDITDYILEATLN